MSSILDRIRAKKAALQQASAPAEQASAPAAIPTPAAPPTPAYAARTASQDIEVGPMPDLDDVTYIQMAFWDNGDAPREFKYRETGRMKKRKSPRYKLTIEAWTVPANQIVKRADKMQFKRNVQLRSPSPFKGKILDANLKSGKISESFFKAAAHVGAYAADEDLLGLIFDREGGWNYFEHQLVRDRFKDGVPVVDLLVNGKTLTVDTFNDYFAKGPITHTARLDLCGYDIKDEDEE